MSNVPRQFDRLIVHQIDLARPSPGGIDTCLRGIAKYTPRNMALGFIGVDAGSGPATRRLGKWEQHDFDGRSVWFMPVAKLDPNARKKRVPHSLRLALGALRFVRRIPPFEAIQAHRMDVALFASLFRQKPLVYMVHTQRGGLTGKTSDSVWRFAGAIHERLETLMVKRASDVVVFNESYTSTVREWNKVARFSPTWWDPQLIARPSDRVPNRLCWVGRLEIPKDPQLALAVVEELWRQAPEEKWSLSVLGAGTLLEELENSVAAMPAAAGDSVSLLGRVEPAGVGRVMAASQSFLMTSHPGYEGYPRVLVEALASGLPAVVTNGSDTGGIVVDGVNGFVTNRDPAMIAAAVRRAAALRPSKATDSVSHLAAPSVVASVMQPLSSPQ